MTEMCQSVAAVFGDFFFGIFFLRGFASARIPDNRDLFEAWHIYYLQILDLM